MRRDRISDENAQLSHYGGVIIGGLEMKIRAAGERHEAALGDFRVAVAHGDQALLATDIGASRGARVASSVASCFRADIATRTGIAACLGISLGISVGTSVNVSVSTAPILQRIVLRPIAIGSVAILTAKTASCAGQGRRARRGRGCERHQLRQTRRPSSHVHRSTSCIDSRKRRAPRRRHRDARWHMHDADFRAKLYDRRCRTAVSRAQTPWTLDPHG